MELLRISDGAMSRSAAHLSVWEALTLWWILPKPETQPNQKDWYILSFSFAQPVQTKHWWFLTLWLAKVPSETIFPCWGRPMTCNQLVTAVSQNYIQYGCHRRCEDMSENTVISLFPVLQLCVSQLWGKNKGLDPNVDTLGMQSWRSLMISIEKNRNVQKLAGKRGRQRSKTDTGKQIHRGADEKQKSNKRSKSGKTKSQNQWEETPRRGVVSLTRATKTNNEWIEQTHVHKRGGGWRGTGEANQGGADKQEAKGAKGEYIKIKQETNNKQTTWP